MTCISFSFNCFQFKMYYKFYYGFFYSAICLILLHGASTQDNDDWLVKYLNELKTILKNGSESIGIPKLDPFTINETIELNKPPEINLHMHIDGTLSNFSDYIVHNANLEKNLSSHFLVTFLNPVLHAKFNINGTALSVIPLDSNGLIDLGLDNFAILLNSRIVAGNKRIQIENFFFAYTITKAQIDIDGLLSEYGLNYILREIIADIAFPLLKKYETKIQNVINNAMPKIANDRLKDLGLRDVIEMIKEKI